MYFFQVKNWDTVLLRYTFKVTIIVVMLSFSIQYFETEGPGTA